MKVEYLILIKKDGSFCEDAKSFINFLSADRSLEINKKIISFRPKTGKYKLQVNYLLKSGEVNNRDERYFLFELTRNDKTRIDEFTELSRRIKKLVEKINPQKVKINTLWDDIALEYAKEAYPLINQVENLMRKLISKFMLINVGMDWSKEAMHSEIKNKLTLKKENADLHFDDIYQADFIQLSEVLFKQYRSVDIGYIDNLLSKAEKLSDLKFAELKRLQPLSNWERYFSAIIEGDEKKIKETWDKLYDYRNKIAHNRGLTKKEYEDVKVLVGEVSQIIAKALESLDSITIKEEEKETIVKKSDDFSANKFIKYFNERYFDDLYTFHNNKVWHFEPKYNFMPERVIRNLMKLDDHELEKALSHLSIQEGKFDEEINAIVKRG